MYQIYHHFLPERLRGDTGRWLYWRLLYIVWAGALVQWLKLPAWKVVGYNPSLALKCVKNKMFLPRSLVKIKYFFFWGGGEIRDWEVACSASDRKDLNFDSCVWRAVLSHSSHHPKEIFMVHFSLYVHKLGLKRSFLLRRLLNYYGKIAAFNFRHLMY